MNVLIFTIGSVIFITYMYFLLRMVNRAHKAQEKAQGKYNYKAQKLEKEVINNLKKAGVISEEWDS